MTRTFFTDRDLGKQFPAILRDAGLTVERHADHFRPTASDEEWLALAGQRGWLAITHDGRIRYKPNELAAVLRHNVMLLVVIGNVPYAELAHHFVRTLPRVLAFAASHEPPFIAKVYRPAPADLELNPQAPGSVTHWYPPQVSSKPR